MKYYLLVFNEDYADEHNVPALDCVTEEQYNTWLNTPSGKLRPEYESEMKLYNEYHKAEKELHAKLASILGNNWASVQFKHWPENLLKEYDELNEKYASVSRRYYPPKKVDSYLQANLGNSGECFEEDYEHLYLMKEFVDAKIVDVAEVSKEFYDIFHENNLSSLSLCNIFSTEW